MFAQSNTTDEGVVINGVKWATRNVDAPGTFAEKPESAGKFYQWNRKKAWNATGTVVNWDNSRPTGMKWTKTNDPCPAGWRVPTIDEIKTLLDINKVSSQWMILNGVNGRKFTDKDTGYSIFLPAVGERDFSRDGALRDEGLHGNYWSRNPNELVDELAYSLDCDRNFADTHSSFYREGLSVRPVAEKK